MIKNKFINFIIFFSIFGILNGCAEVRQSAGVDRKSPDEFRVIENPPLVIPPDYTLVDPNQLNTKNIKNVEKELAEEILFGLDEKNISNEESSSTMNQILFEANTDNISSSIRTEIDEEFNKEIEIEDEINWDNEIDVLDAVKESERIREKGFNNNETIDQEIPIKKIKKEKKKRFILF